MAHWFPGNADLPASGVTPGTYGDATDSARLTVDAAGRITAATTVPITGGGGSAGLVSLFDSTLAVDTAAIDTGAGGVAGGHACLVIFAQLRTDEAADVSNAHLTFNNDTGANYDVVAVQVNNATIGGNQNNALGFIPTIVHGSGGAANYPSSVDIFIPGYDGTTFFKTGRLLGGMLDTSAGSTWVIDRQFAYRSTAAISRLALTAAAGQKLLAGSRLIVYGTQ